MLHIENRGQLQDDGELLPMVERIAACMAGGASVQSVRRADRRLGAAPGWIVFRDEQERGVAVNVGGLIPSRTPLRLRLDAVQHALLIIECFGGRESFPLRLSDSQECPPHWTLYQAQVRSGSILCGVSLPAPDLIAQTKVRPRALPRVRCAFAGRLTWDDLIHVGQTRLTDVLMVECPAQKFIGILRITEEGSMTIQRNVAEEMDADVEREQSSAAGALIRLDLGEIELSLEEIVALRSGTAIELKADMPLRCFMRVGSTTLAQGELRTEERGLVLIVKEVMS
jgi:hypothetical protein